MLPGNTTNNLGVLDLTLDLLDIPQARVTINYNTPNITHKSGLLVTHQFFTG
jgi:hypothetical protein